MIIGRENELRKLKELYDTEYSSFVAVYGRRRIGKTFLVREAFDYRFAFQHTGLANGTKTEQLADFYASLHKAGLRGDAMSPQNWLEAFYLLEQLIDQSTEKKKIVFIDELSWMDTPKSGLVTALESFWNGWASARKDVMLIICASATSWMLDNIIHNKGGLYNRLNAQIHLQPFTLGECRDYIESKNIVLDTYQIIECYMIFGGVPFYWSLLEKGYSLAQNIDRIFFASNAPLKDEFKYLYQALFRNPEKYVAIISALGKSKSGMLRTEMLQKAKLEDSGDISRKLENLENCGFIRKYNKYGKKKRDAYYQLIDNFTLFYFKFLKNKSNDEHFWENNYRAPALNAWRGLAFERVCLEHIYQMKNKLGITGVYTENYSWSCSEDKEKGLFGSQIDLLIVRKDGIINLCEIKYAASEFTITKKVDESIRHKIHDFMICENPRYAIHPILITTYGIIQNEYAGNIQKVVAGPDLFVGTNA